MSRRKLIQFVDNAGNSVRAISHPLVAGGDSHHCTVRIAIQKLPSDCPTFVGTRSVMVGVTVTRFTHDTISCSSDKSARLWAFQYLCRELGYLIATNLRQGTVGNRARNLLFLHSGARDSFVTLQVRTGGAPISTEIPHRRDLGELPRPLFRLEIYVDADHSYEATLRDARTAASKVRPGGYLV